MADSVSSEMDQLRRENARLIGLLEAHGIAWRSGEPAPTEPAPFGEGDSEAAPAKGPSSTQEKVTLFRSLFRGRDDVYALRWQSSSGRSGYAPTREARQLGAALISHTCNATRQLQLSSYDRLFPKQPVDGSNPSGGVSKKPSGDRDLRGESGPR